MSRVMRGYTRCQSALCYVPCNSYALRKRVPQRFAQERPRREPPTSGGMNAPRPRGPPANQGAGPAPRAFHPWSGRRSARRRRTANDRCVRRSGSPGGAPGRRLSLLCPQLAVAVTVVMAVAARAAEASRPAMPGLLSGRRNHKQRQPEQRAGRSAPDIRQSARAVPPAAACRASARTAPRKDAVRPRPAGPAPRRPGAMRP